MSSRKTLWVFAKPQGWSAPSHGIAAARWGFGALSLLAGWTDAEEAGGRELHFGPGARIAIVGDGLAVGMARHGYLETALHLSFPQQNLTVRTFAREGFRIGDEDTKHGPENLDVQLANFGPDLVLVCVGANESFVGPAGAAAFGQVLRERCRRWGLPRPGRPDGARIELLAPLALPQRFPGAPDMAVSRARLRAYAEQMRLCEGARPDCRFMDLAEAFDALSLELAGEVTRDGLRLNRRGHWLLARLLAGEWQLHVSIPEETADRELLDPPASERLRQLVRRKEVDWNASGRRTGELMRGWDQALWSFSKPAPASLWAVEPDSMEPCQEASQSLGMPLPSEFGLENRLGPVEAEQAVRCEVGIEARLWAAESAFTMWNPVSLRFDNEGRAWVGCAPPGRDPCLVRLEDQDRDHRADRQVVAVCGPLQPDGFVPGQVGVFVATDQGVTWYEDRDGNGTADHSEFVIGGPGSRLGLSWGPCGGIWFRMGDPAGADPSAGLTETLWGPVEERRGGLFRWNPAIGRIEECVGPPIRAWGEVRFDPWGEPMISVGSAEMPVGLDRVGHWTQAWPPLHRTGGAAGVSGPWSVLQGPAWRREWQGGCVRAERDASEGWQLRVYAPEWSGSTCRWLRQALPMLQTADPNFAPVAMEIGPDGALYVLEACGRGVRLQAGSYGRIWRIVEARWPPSWGPPAHESEAMTLTQRLLQGEAEGTGGIRLALRQFPAGEVFACLTSLLQGMEPEDPNRSRLLLETLRLHQAFGVPNLELLERLSGAPNPALRHAAANALGEWNPPGPDGARILQRLIEDENPRVRSAAVWCARRIGGEQAASIISLARHQRMDEDFRKVLQASESQMGTAGQSPPSLLAQAAGASTADLLAGDFNVAGALALIAREGVATPALTRAAALLAERAGLSPERWIVERLADHGNPDALLANLEALIALSEGWEIYQSSPALESALASADRPRVRRAVYAALAVGAAESGTFAELVARVRGQGDPEMTVLFEGCAPVREHPKLHALLPGLLRAELGRSETPAAVDCVRVRLSAPGAETLHFAELEVGFQGSEIAQGRPVRQSIAPDARSWWGMLAKNGVNGVTEWQQELPVRGALPGAEAVRGVKIARDANGRDPFWEVDLAEGQRVESLTYHPGETLGEPQPLRFELIDRHGDAVWSTIRHTRNEAPVDLRVAMSGERLRAAMSLATSLGERFRRTLEQEARNSIRLEDRFDALRALHRLGGEVPTLRMRMVDLQFNAEGVHPETLAVAAGTAVEFSLSNGTDRELRLGLFEDAPGIGVPILTLPTLPARGGGRTSFTVPEKPGIYLLRAITNPAEAVDAIPLRLQILPPQK
jgi:HEAT repeat protein/lysophospholipase L1-like esterase